MRIKDPGSLRKNWGNKEGEERIVKHEELFCRWKYKNCAEDRWAYYFQTPLKSYQVPKWPENYHVMKACFCCCFQKYHTQSISFTFHEFCSKSVICQSWKIILWISMTFQVFHNLYEPWLSRILSLEKYTSGLCF